MKKELTKEMSFSDIWKKFKEDTIEDIRRSSVSAHSTSCKENSSIVAAPPNQEYKKIPPQNDQNEMKQDDS